MVLPHTCCGYDKLIVVYERIYPCPILIVVKDIFFFFFLFFKSHCKKCVLMLVYIDWKLLFIFILSHGLYQLCICINIFWGVFLIMFLLNRVNSIISINVMIVLISLALLFILNFINPSYCWGILLTEIAHEYR